MLLLRKILSLALAIILVCSASGCRAGKTGAGNPADEISARYSSCGKITAVARVRFSTENNRYDFRLRFTGVPDDAVIEVLEPESVAGIKVRVADGGTALIAEGSELSTGSVTDLNLSPVSALPLAIGKWQSGYIVQSSLEKRDGTDALRIRQNADGETYLDTWFDTETFLPLSTEIVYNGAVVISIDYENVVLEDGQPQNTTDETDIEVT